MQLSHTASRAGRLSSFLRAELNMSAGLVNRLKWRDQLFVNGVPVHTDYAVRPGDVITVPLEEAAPDYPAQEGRLDILYEDDHLIALDKPPGLLVHPSRSQNTHTLANYVQGYYRATGQKSGCHPITRLDRDTFGVVLMAKNSHIHALFTQLQGSGGLDKRYRARVLGCPRQDEGLIDAPIARRPLPSLLRYVDPSGKPSRTRFWVLERSERALLELQPLTGRTHQLRVHCAHMGFAIAGDPQYGPDPTATGQQLCAHSLAFTHPITGEALCIQSRQRV